MVRKAKNPGAFVANNDSQRPFELTLEDVVFVLIPVRRIRLCWGAT
jgi:hypothetical protein